MAVNGGAADFFLMFAKGSEAKAAVQQLAQGRGIGGEGKLLGCHALFYGAAMWKTGLRTSLTNDAKLSVGNGRTRDVFRSQHGWYV